MKLYWLSIVQRIKSKIALLMFTLLTLNGCRPAYICAAVTFLYDNPFRRSAVPFPERKLPGNSWGLVEHELITSYSLLRARFSQPINPRLCIT